MRFRAFRVDWDTHFFSKIFVSAKRKTRASEASQMRACWSAWLYQSFINKSFSAIILFFRNCVCCERLWLLRPSNLVYIGQFDFKNQQSGSFGIFDRQNRTRNPNRQPHSSFSLSMEIKLPQVLKDLKSEIYKGLAEQKNLMNQKYLEVVSTQLQRLDSLSQFYKKN